MATIGRITTNELIVNSDIQANQLAVTSDVQFSGMAVFSDIVYLDGGANSDLVSGLNADMFDGAQLDTDVTMAADTDVAVPTQHAVKTYADTKVSLTGDETIAGAKTFSSAIVGDLTGKADETDGVVETGTGAATLKCKVIDIGEWNMDAVAAITITTGISGANIRGTYVSIVNDDLDVWRPLSIAGSAGEANATQLILLRTAGAVFDSADFNGTGFSRGTATIWYVQ